MEPTEEKIRLMLFEDNPHLRESLTTLVNSPGSFICVGAFADTRRIIEDIVEQAPQLLLMDIEMPGRNGIEATRLVKKEYPDLPIVMLTAFDDDTRIFQSLCAGGSGYLLKNSTPEQLLAGLLDVYRGESVLSPSIVRRVVHFFHSYRPPAEQYNLTAKETETLQLLAEGKSYKMIADSLRVSLETVKSHMKNIYRKLHVCNASEAVAKAIRQGIV